MSFVLTLYTLDLHGTKRQYASRYQVLVKKHRFQLPHRTRVDRREPPAHMAGAPANDRSK